MVFWIDMKVFYLFFIFLITQASFSAYCDSYAEQIISNMSDNITNSECHTEADGSSHNESDGHCHVSSNVTLLLLDKSDTFVPQSEVENLTYPNLSFFQLKKIISEINRPPIRIL